MNDNLIFIAKIMLMPIEQIPDTLKIDMSEVKKLIKSGTLPFIILQGQEMVRIWDLIVFIENNLQVYNAVGELTRIINKVNDNEK